MAYMFLKKNKKDPRLSGSKTKLSLEQRSCSFNEFCILRHFLM